MMLKSISRTDGTTAARAVGMMHTLISGVAYNLHIISAAERKINYK